VPCTVNQEPKCLPNLTNQWFSANVFSVHMTRFYGKTNVKNALWLDMHTS